MKRYMTYNREFQEEMMEMMTHSRGNDSTFFLLIAFYHELWAGRKWWFHLSAIVNNSIKAYKSSLTFVLRLFRAIPAMLWFSKNARIFLDGNHRICISLEYPLLSSQVLNCLYIESKWEIDFRLDVTVIQKGGPVTIKTLESSLMNRLLFTSTICQTVLLFVLFLDFAVPTKRLEAFVFILPKVGIESSISCNFKTFTNSFHVMQSLQMSRLMTKPRNDCAPSEDSDQPGRPPSLIRVFAER